MVISIVNDSDRGHCCEHLKWKLIYHENWAHDMVFECLCCDEFLSSQKWEKIEFWNFQARPVWVRVISIQYFVCKGSFREISMIIFFILDQSKPISFIFPNFENQKYKICTLHVYCS